MPAVTSAGAEIGSDGALDGVSEGALDGALGSAPSGAPGGTGGAAPRSTLGEGTAGPGPADGARVAEGDSAARTICSVIAALPLGEDLRPRTQSASSRGWNGCVTVASAVRPHARVGVPTCSHTARSLRIHAVPGPPWRRHGPAVAPARSRHGPRPPERTGHHLRPAGHAGVRPACSSPVILGTCPRRCWEKSL
jgi:hypothetical protein